VGSTLLSPNNVWWRDDRMNWLGSGTPEGYEHLHAGGKGDLLAARRLEREGLARWDDGSWRLHERAQVRGARLLLARTARRRPRPPRRRWPTRPDHRRGRLGGPQERPGWLGRR
jgi:hypothetical protein